MKTDKVILGVTLILLGLLFLFANLHIINWAFVTGLWKLWPLALVLWGLDLILKQSAVLKTIIFLLLVLFAFVIYFYATKDLISNDISLRGSEVNVACLCNTELNHFT